MDFVRLGFDVDQNIAVFLYSHKCQAQNSVVIIVAIVDLYRFVGALKGQVANVFAVAFKKNKHVFGASDLRVVFFDQREDLLGVTGVAVSGVFGFFWRGVHKLKGAVVQKLRTFFTEIILAQTTLKRGCGF